MGDICPLPLLFLAVLEARKHKWTMSRISKRDVGNQAIAEWFEKYWHDWYRFHWTQHLNGDKCYEWFNKDEYDIASNIREDKALVKNIISFLNKNGNISENLGIILWASEVGKDITQVIGILRKIDINSKRFIWNKNDIEIICKAVIEADKHKWIESQKAKKDLGDNALYDWFVKYWTKWRNENVK